MLMVKGSSLWGRLELWGADTSSTPSCTLACLDLLITPTTPGDAEGDESPGLLQLAAAAVAAAGAGAGEVGPGSCSACAAEVSAGCGLHGSRSCPCFAALPAVVAAAEAGAEASQPLDACFAGCSDAAEIGATSLANGSALGLTLKGEGDPSADADPGLVGLVPKPSSATRGSMGERVPEVSSREWVGCRRGVRATAACRQRKEKEPCTGAIGPTSLPCPVTVFSPRLALPAAAEHNTGPRGPCRAARRWTCRFCIQANNSLGTTPQMFQVAFAQAGNAALIPKSKVHDRVAHLIAWRECICSPCRASVARTAAWRAGPPAG